jgi:hypothetical protein
MVPLKETEDPTRAKARMESVEPSCKNSQTETREPNRVVLRMLTVEPKFTALIIEV